MFLRWDCAFKCYLYYSCGQIKTKPHTTLLATTEVHLTISQVMSSSKGVHGEEISCSLSHFLNMHSFVGFALHDWYQLEGIS